MTARDQAADALGIRWLMDDADSRRLLDAHAAEVRAAAFTEAADAVLVDTAHIRYGSATDYAERHAALLRRMATAPSTTPPSKEN